VVLTILTIEKQKTDTSHINKLKALKLDQMERIASEAREQDGNLIVSDLK